MRIDIGSIIAVLRTAVTGNMTDSILVEHEGRRMELNEYVDLLEAAHRDPTQSMLLTFTPERIGVIRHEAGE